MNFAIAKKFAKKNLKANRSLLIPFVISSGIMLMLFNIMASLLDNQYVRTRHEMLLTFMILGLAVIAILAVIFVLYSTNFLIKRRNKEFALYGILGLEKKHIRKIISLEYLVLFALIGLMAVIGGYVFGQLTFLGVNKLMRDVSGGLMDFPFSLKAFVMTMVALVVLYIITVARSTVGIYLSTPATLLRKGHSGEGEPKSRYLLTIIGFASLAAGYIMALTIKGVLSALSYFFIAVGLVMLGTYLLSISFSIIVLKALKKRKSYYQPVHFLNVSGLLYRMKSNAVALASITILSTAVIVTVSTTAAIYGNIQTMATNAYPRAYQARYYGKVNKENYKTVEKNMAQYVYDTAKDPQHIKNVYKAFNMSIYCQENGNKFTSYKEGAKPCYLEVTELNGYNQLFHKKVTLQDNEVLMNTNVEKKLPKTIILKDKSYKVKPVSDNLLGQYGVDAYGIVVKDVDTMLTISDDIKIRQGADKMVNARVVPEMNWDLEGESNEAFYTKLKKNNHNFSVYTRQEYLKSVYELNGGFLFLGIIIGIVFLTGTILITYYKQMSEGYEDRDKYQVMKKVGLSDRLIKKTSASQVVWMFFAPLIVASIHCLVASKIIFELLQMFAITRYMQYGIYFIAVLLVFMAVYFIIFKLTSRAYYRIVQ